MAIEWRECVAAREDLRRAIESLEQGAQCRLNFEHDFRAELFDLAGIAAELDRVAERLLRVEENRLPRERRIATPEWYHKITLLRLHLLRAPAPLELGPAMAEIPHQQLRPAEIGVRISVLGIERQRPLVALERLIAAQEIAQRIAA